MSCGMFFTVTTPLGKDVNMECLYSHRTHALHTIVNPCAALQTTLCLTSIDHHWGTLCGSHARCHCLNSMPLSSSCSSLLFLLILHLLGVFLYIPHKPTSLPHLSRCLCPFAIAVGNC